MTLVRFASVAAIAAAATVVTGLGLTGEVLSQAVVQAPAATTMAPTPRMLAIDRGLLLRLSMAGKSVVAQAEQLQKSSEAGFRAEAEKLRADAKAFQQQAAILSPAVKAQKQRELQGREAALQAKMQARGGQIQAGINKAVQQLEVALGPILQQIMRERQADIVVDRGAIVMSRLDMDITAIAIQRLDRAMPRVVVQLTNPPPAGAPGAPRPALPRPPGH